MAAAFRMVVTAIFLVAQLTTALGKGEKVLAEIGVHHIEARQHGQQPSLMRRDPSSFAETAVHNESKKEDTATAAHNATAGTTTAAKTEDHKPVDEAASAEFAAPSAASNLYATTILGSNPVGYWKLGDMVGDVAEAEGPACGQDGGPEFGDLCKVDAKIEGFPILGADSLIKTSQQNKAVQFDGKQKIQIPSSPFINANESGYSDRTLEMWIEAGELGGNNRTIFSEGSAHHSGICIYSRAMGDGCELNMYMWDRGNGDAEYGTHLINPDPLRCQYKTGEPVYIALVYHNTDNKVLGYIKRPGDAEVTICGEMTGLPNGNKLSHHSHHAVIGGFSQDCRVGGDDHALISGADHNFVGTIDEVAIYNRALPKSELQSHVSIAEVVSAEGGGEAASIAAGKETPMEVNKPTATGPAATTKTTESDADAAPPS